MPLVTKFVLAAILLALGFWIVQSWIADACYTDETDQLRCEWTFKQNPMTEAIKCAYYRCTEGCEEAVKKVDPRIFDCSEFCEDGEICDATSPVRIELEKAVTTENKWWHKFTGPRCKWWDVICKGVQNKIYDGISDCKPGRGYRYSDHNLLFPKDSSECELKGAGKDGIIYRRCTLSEGIYYLWTENIVWPDCSVGHSCTSTIICDRHPEELGFVGGGGGPGVR